MALNILLQGTVLWTQGMTSSSAEQDGRAKELTVYTKAYTRNLDSLNQARAAREWLVEGP